MAVFTSSMGDSAVRSLSPSMEPHTRGRLDTCHTPHAWHIGTLTKALPHRSILTKHTIHCITHACMPSVCCLAILNIMNPYVYAWQVFYLNFISRSSWRSFVHLYHKPEWSYVIIRKLEGLPTFTNAKNIENEEDSAEFLCHQSNLSKCMALTGELHYTKSHVTGTSSAHHWLVNQLATVVHRMWLCLKFS